MASSSKDRSTLAKLPDFDLVLFGGTGDLAMRKLLPALFRRYLAGQFPAHARIVSVARSSIERDDYLAQVEESSKKYLPAGLDAARWTTFSRSLDYLGVDATNPADYQKLAAKLANNPEMLNSDPHGEAWLIQVRLSDRSEIEKLMTADEYQAYVQKEEST